MILYNKYIFLANIHLFLNFSYNRHSKRLILNFLYLFSLGVRLILMNLLGLSINSFLKNTFYISLIFNM